MKRIAIVTGASSGIGEAVSRHLIKNGFCVIGNARREEKLLSLRAELGERFYTVTGDASNEDIMEQMLDSAKSVFGSEADTVIANAGRGLGGSVTTADLSQFEEVVGLNLVGTVKFLQKVSNRMLLDLKDRPFPKNSHDIVVLGSTVGRSVSAFSAVYGSTKFAIHSVTEALRREIGPKGIRVSLIEPGIVLSEFQEVAGYSESMVSDFDNRFGPLLIGEDVANAIYEVISQPSHVHFSYIVVRATRQDYP